MLALSFIVPHQKQLRGTGFRVLSDISEYMPSSLRFAVLTLPPPDFLHRSGITNSMLKCTAPPLGKRSEQCVQVRPVRSIINKGPFTKVRRNNKARCSRNTSLPKRLAHEF